MSVRFSQVPRGARRWPMCLTLQWRFREALLAIVALAAIGPARLAAAEDVMADAQASVAAASARVTTWDGPINGPAAVPGKTIVYVASDMRNGGIAGTLGGIQEAAAAIGWQVRMIDAKGTDAGIKAALDEAIAGKPDAIVVGGFDAQLMADQLKRAADSGIKIVAWHGASQPGPITAAGVIVNVATDSALVAKVAADYAIVKSGGTAGVVVFTDSGFSIALSKARAMARRIKECGGCQLLALEDVAISQTPEKMPGETASLLQRFGDRWTYTLAINDLYFDNMGPTLNGAGKAAGTGPFNISGGDGSTSAFDRIRSHGFQIATVAEPLVLQGWQIVDELNRAFSGAPTSHYVTPVHLVTPENIAFDGGPYNWFDPENGYRNIYRRIWGK